MSQHEFREHLLKRWLALEDGEGIRQAHSLVLRTRILGLVFFVAAGLGAIYDFNVWIVIAFALGAGWLIAEANALRQRMEQWPILREFIDWQRVKNNE